MGWTKEFAATDAPTPKPRTPADIGRDIAAAEQRIRDLKAELSDVPPRELVIKGVRNSDYRCVGFVRDNDGSPRIWAERNDGGDDYRAKVCAGTQFAPSDVPRIRAWFDYYFPKEG